MMQEREEATLQQLIEKLAQEAGLPLKPGLAEKLGAAIGAFNRS